MNRRNILKSFAYSLVAFFVPKVRASTVDGLPIVELKDNKVVNLQDLLKNYKWVFKKQEDGFAFHPFSEPQYKHLYVWLAQEDTLQYGCTGSTYWGEVSLNISEYSDLMFINICPTSKSKVVSMPHCHYSIKKV